MKLAEKSGWTLVGDQHFIHAYKDLEQRASTEFARGEIGTNTKLLAAVLRLTREHIPSNPASEEFRLGNTLGERYRSWCRAKFFGRYRLFFRYNSTHKVIIYSWFNSSTTLRKSGGKTDPYAVFQKMLMSGRPPTDFDELLRYSAK